LQQVCTVYDARSEKHQIEEVKMLIAR